MHIIKHNIKKKAHFTFICQGGHQWRGNEMEKNSRVRVYEKLRFESCKLDLGVILKYFQP